MLSLAEAHPALKTLLDKAEQTYQSELAAKSEEQRKQLDRKKQEQQAREQEDEKRKQQEDQARQEAKRQMQADAARLADLREAARTKGIEYANKHETSWNVSSKADEMTDKTILVASSSQTANGVVAELKMKCSRTGVSVTALIVDGDGKPTIELPTVESFLGQRAVPGQIRLNDESPTDVPFFPAGNFRNELNIYNYSLTGDRTPNDIYWRIYASIPTNIGSIILKIPLYDSQVQRVIKSCPQ